MLECVTYDLLARNLGARGDHVAIVEGSLSLTYAELGRRVEEVAVSLASRGIRRGDRVAVHLQKSFDEVVAMFAAWRLGAVVVNVHFQWTARQLDHVLRDCAASALLTDSRAAAAFFREEMPDTLGYVCVKGEAPDDPRFASWTDPSSSGGVPLLPRVPRVDVDLAALLYTSGSTGKPKGVMLTHLNLLTGARSVVEYLKNAPDDRVLSLLPFSFDYGLNQLLTMFLVGGTTTLQKVSMPAEIARSLATHEITGFAAVPPVWISLVDLLAGRAPGLPALRYVTNSGGKIPPTTLAKMPRAFPGVDIYLMYGLTEAFRSTFLPPERFERKMGSIGRAIPNVETFVIKEDGVAGPGEEGELVHRGTLISRGYWGNPQATAERIRPCPQLRDVIGDEKVCYSGDIVRIDEDGDYWFVARADAMIKSSGFRISPTEVEDVVSESGLVTHVVAFGEPDDLLGESVAVAVTSAEGRALGDEELIAHCRRRMPAYMVPKRVHLWPGDMPRTSSGKLDRQAIVRGCADRS
jgi:acyl-CoA ligase (AMP-forming) (exosortase A-associated)